MRKNKNNRKGKITISGNIPRPDQKQPAVIILTQPKRFNIDISDYTSAVRSAENVDFSRRYRLYDLYDDIMMDTHLSCVIGKRKNAVLCSAIEFQRNGKPDDAINEQIKSPWFGRLVEDIIDAKMYGFTLCQFYRNGDWADYDLVPRKHADPVRRLILRNQTDITGTPWEEYPDLLYVGEDDDLGLLAKAAPWVIYKRNTTADWAQFSEVFGMPIQEYIYETDDDDARGRAMSDTSSIGSLGVFIHGKDTELKLIEAGNKTGSADVYERFCERCNNEISKLILGNTLTTEASDTGTQALGTVHKKVEDKVTQADKRYVLNVLNYDMTDIFESMGINTEGGSFCFPEQKDVDPNTKMSILTQLRTSFNLPVDDDYLYEEFGIEKPKDYEKIKSQLEEDKAKREQALQAAQNKQVVSDDDDDDKNDDDNKDQDQPKTKKGFKNWLRSFFVTAPQDGGADLDW